jgi:hypothetical protein
MRCSAHLLSVLLIGLTGLGCRSPCGPANPPPQALTLPWDGDAGRTPDGGLDCLFACSTAAEGFVTDPSGVDLKAGCPVADGGPNVVHTDPSDYLFVTCRFLPVCL